MSLNVLTHVQANKKRSVPSRAHAHPLQRGRVEAIRAARFRQAIRPRHALARTFHPLSQVPYYYRFSVSAGPTLLTPPSHRQDYLYLKYYARANGYESFGFWGV